MSIKKIAVATTGGDAPGMNTAIRAVVRCAIARGLEVRGVLRGWWGLINDETRVLDSRSVSGIINQGGTILKTARCQEFHTEEGRKRAYETLKKYSIDAMVVIGGNGSFTAADEFSKRYKVSVVGIPASIDNDINGIDITIGTDTAINTALSAIDNIRDTATSMERIFVVEVMGRDSGYIALSVALAGGCEEVIIPERKVDLQAICSDIVEGNIRGKVSWIIVVAEGAARAEDIAGQIKDVTGLQTRAVVVGHVQRGGRPTASSRELALRLGRAAVETLLAGKGNKVVGLSCGKIIEVELESATARKKFDPDKLYSLIKVLS